MTKEIKNLIKLTISAIIAAFAIAGAIFAFTYESKIEEAKMNGYSKAIEEAILVSIDDDGYTINFGGELHNYTFK